MNYTQHDCLLKHLTSTDRLWQTMMSWKRNDMWTFTQYMILTCQIIPLDGYRLEHFNTSLIGYDKGTGQLRDIIIIMTVNLSSSNRLQRQYHFHSHVCTTSTTMKFSFFFCEKEGLKSFHFFVFFSKRRKHIAQTCLENYSANLN